jgi:hypothetical protein
MDSIPLRQHFRATDAKKSDEKNRGNDVKTVV